MSENQSNTPPGDELIGKTLGQFTILQEIGRGGMATVYKATQKSINRQVAIKVLPKHFLHDPNFLERFNREVEVISALEHPHILPIYDYGEADGVPFIAMRYLGGGNLAQMIQQATPDIAAIVKPVRQIADALDYAHQQGIVHRDLKPGNIMLDEHGNAYLSDFGIARVMGSDLTGSAIIGTPAYMSPEQAQGGTIDGRSDVYALGVVLFEMLTGQEPFQSNTPMGVLLMHLNEPIPPISQFRKGVPDAVQEVVTRSTEKNPDDRYASAGEMARALNAAVNGNPTPSLGALLAAPAPADTERTITENVTPLPNQGGTLKPGVVPAASLPQTMGEAPPQPSGNRNLAAIIAVALLVVIMGAGGLLLASGTFGTQTAPLLTPTPFRGATIISADQYSISLPDDWDFNDQSTIQRMLHTWTASNQNLAVSLSIVDRGDRTISGYAERRYADEGFAFIDEATAEDGTVRYSYRVQDHERLANGQVDAFFITQAEQLVVLEFYTSDAVADDPATIDTLQLVLQSLRLQDA